MTSSHQHASLRTGTGAVLVALVLVLYVAIPARGSAPMPATAGNGPEEEEALGLLAAAMDAEGDVSYHGMRFVSGWSRHGTTTHVTRVASLAGGGTFVEAADDGDSRYERRAGPGADDGAVRSLNLLSENYRLTVTGAGSVAGRAATVVTARRGDGSLAARFWLDRQTGLVLRRETHDRGGRTVRVSAFVKLVFRAPRHLDEAAAEPSMPSPWPDRLRRRDLVSLRSSGWTLPRMLPGGLQLVQARKGVADGRKVIHLSYSDGLNAVSVFVQRGSLATDRLGGWRKTRLQGCCVIYRQNAFPRRVVWSGNGHVYTIVADAPPRLIGRVVSALPHARHSGGVVRRMTRGFNQMGVWLNPF